MRRKENILSSTGLGPFRAILGAAGEERPIELYRGRCRDCGTDNIDEIMVTNPWDGHITITYHCKGDGCARQETLRLDQVDLAWLAKHLADLSRRVQVPAS